MKLSEQVKKRLQKLAGVTPGKKATPKKGGGITDTWYGCSICDNNTDMPGETACLPLWPITLTIENNGNSEPGSSDWENLSATEYGGWPPNPNAFGDALGSDGQPYDGFSHQNVVGTSFPTLKLMVNGVLTGMYSEEEWCPGGTNGGGIVPDPEHEADCASYPAACCLQQVYGQDIFGTTIEHQGEQINVPSAEECEGFTMTGAGTNSTPYPYPGYTFYDGVTYSHNPNNSFEQGCCYPLV